MTDDDLVVGYGLVSSATDIVEGRMPYEKVKSVYVRVEKEQPIQSGEDLERWIDARLAKGATWVATVRRLWADGKIFCPALWGIQIEGPDRWVPWKEFK